jgi:hypothetical protein
MDDIACAVHHAGIEATEDFFGRGGDRRRQHRSSRGAARIEPRAALED